MIHSYDQISCSNLIIFKVFDRKNKNYTYLLLTKSKTCIGGSCRCSKSKRHTSYVQLIITKINVAYTLFLSTKLSYSLSILKQIKVEVIQTEPSSIQRAYNKQ